MTMFSTAKNITEIRMVNKYRLLFTFLGLNSAVLAQTLGDPIDANRNGGVLTPLSVHLVPSSNPDESAIEVTFDKPIILPANCEMHGFGARKFPIVPESWSTPQMYDLDRDGDLDLVSLYGGNIYAYYNQSEQGGYLFDEPVAVTEFLPMEPFDSGSDIALSTLTIASLSNASSSDLVVGHYPSGKIVMIPDQQNAQNLTDPYSAMHSLRYLSPEGVLEEINFKTNGFGLDPSVYSNFFANSDDALAYRDYSQSLFLSVAFSDIDNNGSQDLVVARHRSTSNKEVVFLTFPNLGNNFDPESGQTIPYYGQPSLLSGDGGALFLGEDLFDDASNPIQVNTSYPVISFINTDDDPALELFVSTGKGFHFVAHRSDSADGFLPFSVIRESKGTSRPSSGKPFDADPSSAGVELLVCEFETVGPARRMIRIYDSFDVADQKFDNAQSEALANYATSTQFLTSIGDTTCGNNGGLVPVNLNGDHFMDFMKGGHNGEIIVRFSVDSGNDLNPYFSSPVYARNEDGEVFAPFSSNLCAGIIPLNLDNDPLNIPEGFILSVAERFFEPEKLYFSPFLSVDGEGCPVLGDPRPITLPLGLVPDGITEGEAGALAAAVVYGASGADPVALYLKKRFRSTAWIEHESIFSLDLDFTDGAGNPIAGFASRIANSSTWQPLLSDLVPELSNPTYILSTTLGDDAMPILGASEFTAWDFDGDGDVDIALSEGGLGIRRWWENRTETGEDVPVLGKPLHLVRRGQFRLRESEGSIELFDDINTLAVYRDMIPDTRNANPICMTSLTGTYPDQRSQVKVYELLGKSIDPAFPDAIELGVYERGEDAIITQSLASSASLDANDPRKVTFNIPLGFTPGDRIRVNLVNVLDDELVSVPVSFDSLVIGGVDSDLDGIADAWEWELINSLGDPAVTDLSHVDADSDFDGDLLSALDEYRLGLGDNNRDFDGDGLSDQEELAFGSSPFESDTDGDGYTDLEESVNGTDPNTPELDPAIGTMLQLRVLTPLHN